MKEQLLTKDIISDFKEHLILEERSGATIEKYIRDVTAFAKYLNGKKSQRKQLSAIKSIFRENMRFAALIP